MATITLNFDAQNDAANKLIEGILATGLFYKKETAVDGCDYDKDFMQKIDTSRLELKKGKGKAIKTDDLWK